MVFFPFLKNIFKKFFCIMSWLLLLLNINNNNNRKHHWKLESWTDSRRKKLNLLKNSEKDLPGRCAIIITICNSNDATQSHTQVNLNFINHKKKINHLMYMDDIKLFGNIGSGLHQTCGDERKNQKRILQENENYSKPDYMAEISSKR